MYEPHTSEIVLIYDGQCPACRYYSTMLRIQESLGRLVLVDARAGGPILEEITARGLDIDQGMVVKIGEQLYYGADALHVLALMGTNQGLFNRCAYWVFRSRTISRTLYPALRACRNLLLKLLGKSKINNLGHPDNAHF